MFSQNPVLHQPESAQPFSSGPFKKASYSTAARRLPDDCQTQTQPSSMAFDKIRNDELATHGFDERLARITTPSQGWRQRAREICTQTSLDFSHIDSSHHYQTWLRFKVPGSDCPFRAPTAGRPASPMLCAALVRRSFSGIPSNYKMFFIVFLATCKRLPNRSQERPYVNSSVGPYGPHNH